MRATKTLDRRGTSPLAAGRTLIGITCAEQSGSIYSINRSYVEGILQAGGLPFLLPPSGVIEDARAYTLELDGLLLTGGGDIDPSYYGQEPQVGLGDVAPLRDALELELTRRFYELNKPILAICRGLQVLNVALGGSVHQDIGKVTSIKHFQSAPRWAASHTVTLENGSKLMELYGTSIVRVNSMHHQAADHIANQLIVTARSADGLAEALEASQPGQVFVMGVQWHPETMVKREPRHLKLFAAFVEAAGRIKPDSGQLESGKGLSDRAQPIKGSQEGTVF